jgi:hypothetical protein
MTFQPVALDTLPKRLVRGKTFDTESANALLALVTAAPGQGASDDVEYNDQGEARKAAGKARRLLVRVAPNAELVKSRVYETAPASGKFRWVVSLSTEAPAKRKAK